MPIFSLHAPLEYLWHGMFSSPREDWVHISRVLSEYELIIVTEGTLYLADDQHRYEVHAGQYLLMSPTPRQYGYQASRCSFHWLHFRYPENSVSPETYELPVTASLDQPDRILPYLNQLYYVKKQYDHPLTGSYLLTSLILELYHQTRPRTKLPLQSASIQKEQLVKSIKEYIHYNNLSSIRISQIARHFGYNEKYLTGLFKSVCQIPLKQYLMEAQMEQARDLLLNSTFSITQIGLTLGYSDVHNFSHAFKKASGISPREFRNAFYVDYT